MFYELQVKSHVRVPPVQFKEDAKEAVLNKLNQDYDGYISQDVGFVICVTELIDIGEGLIIPEDGAIHYETEFKLLTYIPELQEIVLGKTTDITNFGAFITLGPVEGMIHVSQTMDDFISFNKARTLSGKESKRVLKVGDKCRARIIAISYKDPTNPKIGLTMRQPWLGCLNWIKEDLKKKNKKKKK